MDVARPILDPQDVGRLGQVRHDRVVAGHLPLVRVVAPRRPFDLQPRRHDDAVHIDRPGAQPQRGQQLAHDGRVEGLEAGDRPHREVPQPPTQRPRGGHDAHVAEPLEDRVVGDGGQMPQAPAANDHQPDEHPHHHHHPEVAPARQVGKRLAHQLIEATGAQVALQEFQPGVRREANVIELQRQIPIDTGMQIGFSSSHGQWPFMCGRRRWVAPPFNHTGRPFSIPKRHCSLRKMTH